MGSAFSRRFRVLVVTPDREFLDAASDAFAEKGLDVSALPDPASLNEGVVRTKPDLVLLDADIPRFDARDVVCCLKVDSRTVGVPIFLMTGEERHWGRSFAIEIGVEEYLDKPLALRSVAWRVRSHLETRANEQPGPVPEVASLGDRSPVDRRQVDLFRQVDGERAQPTHPPRAYKSDRPILIVEDDEDLRELLAHILESEGLTTLAARNGQEALDILHGEGVTPGLILLDLMMPIMNGWEFRERFASDASIPDVPVVVMSARSRDDSVSSAAWLQKPLRAEELLTTVQQVALAS